MRSGPRLVLATLRALVLGGVLLMLMEAVLVVTRPELIDSHLLVLLDVSESMSLTDAYTKEDQARQTASKLGLLNADGQPDLAALRQRSRFDLAQRRDEAARTTAARRSASFGLHVFGQAGAARGRSVRRGCVETDWPRHRSGRCAEERPGSAPRSSRSPACCWSPTVGPTSARTRGRSPRPPASWACRSMRSRRGPKSRRATRAWSNCRPAPSYSFATRRKSRRWSKRTACKARWPSSRSSSASTAALGLKSGPRKSRSANRRSSNECLSASLPTNPASTTFVPASPTSAPSSATQTTKPLPRSK